MPSALDRKAAEPDLTEALERECEEVMTRDVIAVPADASLPEVAQALAEHGVSAVLVVRPEDRRPLGWIRVGDVDVQAEGARAEDCIGERVTGILPAAPVRVARYALSLPGVSRLAVRQRGDGFPVGVITELDVGDLARSPEKE